MIVANGQLHSGNIERLTKNYPLAKWCRNEKKDIVEAIVELSTKNLDIQVAQRSTYSRRNGLTKLIKLLENGSIE